LTTDVLETIIEAHGKAGFARPLLFQLQEARMSNVVTLHADKRWKAIIEYRTNDGPDWNFLIRCTVTLNRTDDGEEQNSVAKALRDERFP
jgi:hypothetical protein